MYRLYSYPPSANCYKIELLFHQLNLPLEIVELDIEKGHARTNEFLKINPFQLTPALEVRELGRILVESDAILWYFGRNTKLGPGDAWSEYETLKWMTFEQNALEPNIGRARRLLLAGETLEGPSGDRIAERQRSANAALDCLDRAIGSRQFLVGDSYGIADIAIYGYTHVAPQGGIPLQPFGNIRRWLANVQATPRFKAFAFA